jgi:hypothetical protein
MPKDELVNDREDEESQLPEMLRNLKITPSDDGCMSETDKKDEELP